jgi:hypothetical protein
MRYERVAAHKGVINVIYRRQTRQQYVDTAERNNTIEVMSLNLTVVWFIFRKCLHFVLCVREKLEKRREIGIIFKANEEKDRDINVGIAAVLTRNVREE